MLEGLRSGSEAHFGELYNRYFQRIYTFSFGRLRNHADAEEITQETFTAVFRSIENFRGQSALLSWIYGIAKNTANNHLRRNRTQERRIEEATPELVRSSASSAGGDPEEMYELHCTTEAIERKLSGTAQWQVEIFRMRHLEDLSISEICERTQRSSDAVRSSLYRVKRLVLDAAESTSSTGAGS